jgi:poly(A) polymerase
MQELNCDQAKEYVDNIGPCQWIRASVSPYEENAQDKQLDESLQDFIKEASPLADDEERERREMTLESLTQIWKAWVYETCIAKGKPPEIARAAGGTVLTSGSFKLGVEARGTDIDAICVAPM